MGTVALFGLFGVFLLMKIPIPFSLALSGMLTLILVTGRPVLVVVQRMATSMESFSLLAIPLFILAGEIINKSGAGERLVRFANMLVGHVTGGLAHSNILASMFFGGISGSASADTAAIGSILIPAMSKSGYSKEFATAVTITSSPIGNLIPPSITLVIYGWLAGVQVSRLFVAGIVPGILVGFMLMGLAYVLSKKHNYGTHQDFNLKELWRSFLDAMPALVLPVIILGGMFSGIFTATEAAAVAVVYSLFISLFIYRKPGLADLPGVFVRSCKLSGGVVLLIAMTGGFGWIMSIEKIPIHLSQFFLAITPNSLFFLFSVIAISLLVGCFLTPTSALVLLVPVLFPVAQNFGVDPLHFGMVLVSALVIGHVTPPVGLCLYIGSSISGIPVTKLIKPIMPFFGVLLLLSVLVALFPGLVLTLPRLLL
jgi:C4-dicarboxylate transporter DctM subunit